MSECYFCDLKAPLKEEEINLYYGSDGFLLDIERPLECIPEHCRSKPLYINYCPICGKRLELM